MPMHNRNQRSGDRQRTPQKFWIHLAVFLVVNAGLITLNLIRSPDKYWFHWVLLGWGAGLLLNAYRVFGCCGAKGCRANAVTEPAPDDRMNSPDDSIARRSGRGGYKGEQ